MYRNLEAELARRGFTKTQFASEIGMPYTTFIDKMSGKTGFLLKEAFAIRNSLNLQMSLSELFEDAEGQGLKQMLK